MSLTLVQQTAHPASTAGSVGVYALTDGGVYARFGAVPVPLVGGAAAPGLGGISAAGGLATSGVTFANTVGLSFGVNASTITASLPTMSWIENQGGNPSFVNSAAINSAAPNVSFQRIMVPFQLQATRLDYIGALSVNGSQAFSSTMSLALYTMNGSTAGLVSSASGTDNAVAGQYTNYSGTRWRSVPVNWAVTPGEYGLVMIHSLSTPAGSTGQVSIFGESNIAMNPNPGGAAVTDYFAEGIGPATGAPAASYHLSQIDGSHAAAGAMPYFRLVGTF